jgi:N,N'-diacetyllegionaminate synthase
MLNGVRAMNMFKKIIVIAEAGVNHNGSLSTAMQMVKKAKEAGADFIKFQTFIPELVMSKYAQKAEYQITSTGSEETQLEMVRKLKLSYKEFRFLKDYCAEHEMLFLSTPFDLKSIDFLDEIGMPLWKIPSGEVTNLPFLMKIAKTGKPIIMSTGMCTLDDIEAAIQILNSYGCSSITLLHCTTEYPTPYKEVNLNAIETLRNTFKLPIGYSDHTKGITIPIAAAALGSVVIEKHFTLDRNMEGPDHAASLEPEELKAMVEAIRCVEISMGDGIKKPTASESKNMVIARKSIVASKPIMKGEKFSKENITSKRPGSGISPMRWNEVIGQTAKHSFGEDELIEL